MERKPVMHVRIPNQVRSLLLLITLCALASVVWSAEDVVWIEGESPTRANVATKGVGWGNVQYLSDEKWLNFSVPVGQLAEQVPDGGIVLSYDFDLAQAGDYAVWNRIGYERVRSDFEWRVDEGEWRALKASELTTDLMDIDTWCEVAWIQMGSTQLGAGKHTLEIRLRSGKNAEGQPTRILYASDLLCLHPGTFRPNGANRPGAEWRTEDDLAAAQNVFDVQGAAPGARAVTDLSGIWEIARADEQEIVDRLGPVETLPQADKLYWRAIAVPGDRNALRPEMVFCHRYIYRTKLRVPADAAGRGMFLHFPSTNMVVTVFVNGQQCGWNKAPFAIWDCDITGAVRPGEVNDLQIVVKDTYYGLTGNTRASFNLPTSVMDTNQGTSMRLDMPVWHHRQNGILEKPTLVVAGDAYTTDVFAIPSVRDKTLGLEISLRNSSPELARLRVENEIVPLGGGKAEKTFEPVELLIGPGREETVALKEGWAEPKLWWPDDPQQYEVITRLYAGDKLVDTRRTKFGFREWEWNSAQFRLNGVRWQGRADLTEHGTSNPEEAIRIWRKNGQTMFRFWATQWGGMGMGDTLDFMDAHGVPVRRSGIFDGELASYGLATWTEEDGKRVKHPNNALFDNWIHRLRALVRGERNHPSVFVWSVENEITYINACNLGNLDVVEPEVRRAVEAVMKIDPTRPGMVDGGRALTDRSLPINGCHYNDPADRELPDMAYTMERIYNQRSRGKWLMRENSPVFLGEAFYANGRKPSGFAAVGGEETFLGRAETKRAVALLCQMMSEGYRWHGLAAFHYWMSSDNSTGHYNSWQPVCVLCRQWNWTFGAGSMVRRTLKVLNDTRHPEPIEMGWRFELDGRVVAEDRSEYRVAPGMDEETEISFTVPPVTQRTAGRFILTCARGGKEVFREVKDVWVIDPSAAPLPQVGDGEIAVWDPSGAVEARLKLRGVPFRSIDGVDSEPPAGAKLLIVGPDALTSREATDPKWKRFAAAGLRVLVLDQEQPLHYQAIPADLEPTPHVGRIAFSENLQHPVFAGLDQPDFFTWSGDHVVYRRAYRKSTHGARSLMQCDDELRCSALAECPLGEGLLLLSQLAMGAKLESDPVAQRLLDNMVNYCLAYHPVRKTTSVVASPDGPVAKLLNDVQLQFDSATDLLRALQGTKEIVIAEATPEVLARLAKRRDVLEAFTARGGWLMLMGLTPEGLADFNRLVGVEHMIRPFERERVTMPARRDPLLSGLTTRDVVMESPQKIAVHSGDRWMSDDEFTYVVDLDEVAPFATWPGPDYWNQPEGAPGSDHWPRNMVNGFVASDYWRYIFSILLFQGEPTKWTIELPREEEIVGFSIAPNAIYHKLTKVRLVFDGDRSVELDVEPQGSRQDFEVPSAKARKIGIELVDWDRDGRQDVIGIDNLWIYAKRSEDFRKRVVGLLNIGGLVKYPMGTGGVLLNQLRIQDREALPENRQKKATITGTILRNLGATFAGGSQDAAGVAMTYHPIALGDKCNQFLTPGQDHWFQDEKNRGLERFPIGRNRLVGVDYLVRDFRTSPLPACVMLQVGGRLGVRGAEWEVRDMPVGRKADALFFLHTFNRTPARDRRNYVAFRYTVHYADGETVEIPVRYGEDIGHWALKEPKGLKNAALAWAAPFGNDPESYGAVYQMRWDNPRPDVEIQSIDMGYRDSPRAAIGHPALLGVTAAQRVK
jgi:glycosyl hydrolase family 2